MSIKTVDKKQNTEDRRIYKKEQQNRTKPHFIANVMKIKRRICCSLQVKRPNMTSNGMVNEKKLVFDLCKWSNATELEPKNTVDSIIGDKLKTMEWKKETFFSDRFYKHNINQIVWISQTNWSRSISFDSKWKSQYLQCSHAKRTRHSIKWCT